MQRARVRSPVGTSFLGEVFRGFSSPVRQMSGSFRPPRSPNIIWASLSSIIIHYGRQWPEMLMHPKTSNIHTYIHTQRGVQYNYEELHFHHIFPFVFLVLFLFMGTEMDRIHCLKCFSHNVSGVDSTPVFRWGFVVRTTVYYFLLF